MVKEKDFIVGRRQKGKLRRCALYVEAASNLDRVRLGGKCVRVSQYEPDRQKK
ncbi:hypothetical protein BDZ91DRAFT_349741 [Kalaharituber pfeilii]|nr:hypothetical protein BDZ91DRAFT_349741 [Kalaharituber pfeilii]